MLKEKYLHLLNHKKNLLAFSGGGDSTALFYLLLKYNITFDIAIVDYGLREQSKLEVIRAQKLATEHQLKCYVHYSDKITSNFEKNARLARYTFFDSLIQTYHYNNLLTAHHLGDKLEWLLMQLTKGAGLAELLGMNDIETKKKHTLIRPLLEETKESLQNYLREHKYSWFEDVSNQDQGIKRNYFRHNFTDTLLQDYAQGIKKSFSYLKQDLNDLQIETTFTHHQDLSYAKNSTHTRSNEIAIDREIKRRGYILSAIERTILKEKREIIVARSLLVSITDSYIYIAPYEEDIIMDKVFKEACRVLKVPSKLRPYLFKESKVYDEIKLLLI